MKSVPKLRCKPCGKVYDVDEGISVCKECGRDLIQVMSHTIEPQDLKVVAGVKNT